MIKSEIIMDPCLRQWAHPPSGVIAGMTTRCDFMDSCLAPVGASAFRRDRRNDKLM